MPDAAFTLVGKATPLGFHRVLYVSSNHLTFNEPFQVVGSSEYFTMTLFASCVTAPTTKNSQEVPWYPSLHLHEHVPASRRPLRLAPQVWPHVVHVAPVHAPAQRHEQSLLKEPRFAHCFSGQIFAAMFAGSVETTEAPPLLVSMPRRSFPRSRRKYPFSPLQTPKPRQVRRRRR